MSSSARADAPPPVTVVELDGTGAAALRLELAQAGFAVISAPELDAATAGVDGGKDLGEALAALARARDAFGALDCPAALLAADSAIAVLAARGAAGIDVAPALRAAWSYVLLCRDRAGELDGAWRAAEVLRALATAAEPVPPGIDAAVWSKFPEVDVTAARDIIAVELTAEPGAVLTVDHRPVGTSPATVYVPAGRHVIAASLGSRRAAMWTELSGRTRSISLRLFEQDAPLSRISERVTAWRAQGPDGPGVAAFFEQLIAAAQGQSWNPRSARSPLLVVLGAASTPRQIQIWSSDGPGRPPSLTTVPDPAAGGAAHPALIDELRKRHLQWREVTEPAPSTLTPLLLDQAPAERAQPDAVGRRRNQWWVYAAIGGAVALGGAVLLANELADDTQRVELRWP